MSPTKIIASAAFIGNQIRERSDGQVAVTAELPEVQVWPSDPPTPHGLSAEQIPRHDADEQFLPALH